MKSFGAAMVYSETIVHWAPERLAADAPYQVALIDLDSGGRLTVRIAAEYPQEQVKIGDRVVFLEERGGVAYYKRA